MRSLRLFDSVCPFTSPKTDRLIMPNHANPPRIALPNGWGEHVKSAVLHVISLTQFSAAYTRGWAANSPNERMRPRVRNDRLQAENVLLREEIRIKDARMGRLPAARRPHYPPTERMAILEMKMAWGWSRRQTAKTFILAPATIVSWVRRVDEDGPRALVRLRSACPIS